MDIIKPFVKPLDILYRNIQSNVNSEMSQEQLAFLCGLIQKKTPKKILELGVASGGTTCAVLQCLECLALNTEVYSVDINELLYSDKSRRTGYIADKIKKEGYFQGIKHQFLLGKYLPEQLEVIGKGIDFVILDTVHYLPGELMDYLAVIPFCTKDAVFVLHDIDLCHYPPNYDDKAIATGLLYSLINAEKYVSEEGYKGIAAFSIKQDSFTNNVFFAMFTPWDYWPGEHQLNLYIRWFEKYYSSEMCALFINAIEQQRNTLSAIDAYLRECLIYNFKLFSLMFRNLYFYGNGKRGKGLYYCLEQLKLVELFDEIKFVVSDDRYSKCNEIVLKDISSNSKKDYLLIIAAKASDVKHNAEMMNLKWFALPEKIWRKIENIMDVLNDKDKIFNK